MLDRAGDSATQKLVHLNAQERAMFPSQAPYRELCNLVAGYKGNNIYADVLHPWLVNSAPIQDWLSEFSARIGEPIPEASNEELCQLYALSRVSQLLLLRFQPGRADGTDWPGANVTADEYADFMLELGFAPITSIEFSPFEHEIVEVFQDEQPDAKISVIGLFWPGFMLGNMMFSRAGAWVAGGLENLDKSVAEQSTLYWAYRRKNRPTQDLSYGWGSNSQWRTPFRRDYQFDRVVYYNVDGKRNLNLGQTSDDRDPDQELDLQERIELLQHRYFITVRKPHQDWFPYDYFYCQAS